MPDARAPTPAPSDGPTPVALVAGHYCLDKTQSLRDCALVARLLCVGLLVEGEWACWATSALHPSVTLQRDIPVSMN